VQNMHLCRERPGHRLPNTLDHGVHGWMLTKSESSVPAENEFGGASDGVDRRCRICAFWGLPGIDSFPSADLPIAMVNHLFPAIRSGSSVTSRIFRLVRAAGTGLRHAAEIE
jgi:hypothetical protein